MGEDAIIVAIVFGSILGVITIPLLISLLKTWINRNKNTYDEEKFDRLAKAFIKHKKDMERRVQHTETIVMDKESASIPSSQEKIKPSTSHKSIEIDANDSVENHPKTGHINPKNDLNKKRTT